MKNVLIAILTVCCVGIFCGCLKGGSSSSSFTCNYNECEKVAPAAEIDSLKKYLAIKGISATQHCSGVFYTVDTLGAGVNPGACSNVAFAYEGKLLNDTTFEKSNGPVVANMGNLILGFRNVLPKIKVGGHMHMYIPPSLGYGNTSPSPKVPANSYLIYEVALAGAQ